MKKIAIHHRSGSYSDRWITYCDKKNIAYKIVNAFDNSIIKQLEDCDALLWHHNHISYKDVKVAKKILFALEHAGVKIFPDFKTGWHFDDKVAQKYLLEAINAPIIKSYVFYDKKEALIWAKETEYPKVFKLKGGAGALNVRLVKSKKESIKLINKAFGKGFPQFDRFIYLNECFRKFRDKQENLLYVLKGLTRIFIRTNFNKNQPNEKGYIYFQDFVRNNIYDTRVVVIAEKYAAAEKRFVRKNDFRASGSGVYSYDDISIDTIKIAFNIAKKLGLQSVAFDFIKNEDGDNLIVEMSYAFGTKGISNAPGYWDDDLTWYQDKFIPQNLIIDEIIKKL